MSHSPPQIRSSGNPSDGTTNAQKKRWRYTLNQRDFGPFTGEQLEEKILEADLPPETPIFEEWEGVSLRLADIPEFAEVLENVERQKRSEALVRETQETEGKVASARQSQIRITGGILALVALSIGLWMSQSPSFTGSGDSEFAASLFQKINPERLQNVSLVLADKETMEGRETAFTNDNSDSTRNPARPRSRKRKAPSGGSSGDWVTPPSGGILIQSGPTASSMDFDFEEQEGGRYCLSLSPAIHLPTALSSPFEMHGSRGDSNRQLSWWCTTVHRFAEWKSWAGQIAEKRESLAWVDKMRTESICRASVLSLQWIRTFSADTCAGE